MTDGCGWTVRTVSVLAALWALACVIGGWIYAGAPDSVWDFMAMAGTHLGFLGAVAFSAWAFKKTREWS